MAQFARDHRRVGRYEILGSLATGGMAEIYLATGHPESAVAVLRRAGGLDRSPQALLLLGRAYRSLKSDDAAERTACHHARKLLQARQVELVLDRAMLEPARNRAGEPPQRRGEPPQAPRGAALKRRGVP